MGGQRKGRAKARSPRRTTPRPRKTGPPAHLARAGRKAAPSRSSAPPFLIAAVGASAGGLEAFSSLLRAIPGDAQLALILVQHLARDQTSILPELLGNVSALKVVSAQDESAIEPRHVYVIPPDARMTVSDGHLRVRPAAAQREAEGTVDFLFRSIASEYRERAIGVVLSGSANDGAAGIREIKAVGGMTLAQQPEQAAVDGMPRAAIATGTVDAVLPVEEIGAHLVRLASNPLFTRTDPLGPELPVDVAQMLQVFQLLRRASGIDFTNYKVPTLRRRIERRLALNHLPDIGKYVDLLRRDPMELKQLEGELLIHVTSFFREPASYATLEELVFPRLFARERDQDVPVRCWVPGCSTGEEVYSLAIVALELLGERADATPLQIFGTDISDAAVEKARTGVYPAGIAADVSSERLRRFFTRFDGGYRISKEVRDRCVFARQDVTRDPPFSRLDLIVCRNLLIYLNQATQRKVLGVFHYALRPQGMLMLGGSETIGARTDLFSLFAKKFQLYKKKSDGDRQGEEIAAAPPPKKPARPAAGKAPSPPIVRPAGDLQSDVNRLLLDKYAPPAVVVDGDLRIVRSRGSTGAFLELPSGEVSVDILKMVRPELGYPLREILRDARVKARPASKPARFRVDGRVREVELQAIPLGAGAERQFLVLFEERTANAGRAPRKKGKEDRKSAAGDLRSSLERELADTRRQLHSIIDDLGAANEELQSANEEILSSNEELQSTNEELDTAKEELQSTNEELTTVNDELRGRNEELNTANSDLVNLLASVQIPIVMVTRDLRIRRITPAAEKVLNVIPSDLGRPIGHLKPNFVCPELESLIVATIYSVTIHEREVEGAEGRTFALQIRPYQTVDNRIDGAVIILFDVTNVQDSAAALKVARSTGEALISAIEAPVLLLDGNFKVQRANRAFTEMFRVGPDETAGRFVYELGDRDWDLPELRRLLEEVLPQRKNFEGFAVDHVFSRVGRKRLVLDARRIESGRKRQGVILLIIREAADDGG